MQSLSTARRPSIGGHQFSYEQPPDEIGQLPRLRVSLQGKDVRRLDLPAGSYLVGSIGVVADEAAVGLAEPLAEVAAVIALG